jgi:beta-glucanase (GH16 family)
MRSAAPAAGRRPDRARRWSRPLVTALAVGAAVATLVVAIAVSSAGPAPPPTDGSSPVLLDEEFDTVLDPAVWNTCHWWADGGCTIESNAELQWYLPGQVSVADGQLRLTAVPEEVQASNGETYPFRSGMVTTGPPADERPAKLAFRYGSVEARVKLPAGRGLWPAIWLLPANQDSRPEIDLLEVLGQDPAELIMHLHPEDRSAQSPSKRVRLRGPSFAADWHTVRLDWQPRRLTFLLDGREVWRVTGSRVPNEPMYLVLNLAVGGVYPGDPDRSTPFPATFAVDRLTITGAAS